MVNMLVYFFAFVMLAGAVGHIVMPDFYAALIPAPIPKAFANGLAAVVEGLIGVGLLLPRLRRLSGLAFTLLMVAFVPLHIWDALKEAPMVGSHTAAIVRLIIQALLIAGGVAVYRSQRHSRPMSSNAPSTVSKGG